MAWNEMLAYAFETILVIAGILIFVIDIRNRYVMWRESRRSPRLLTLSFEQLNFNITCKPHDWTKTKLALRGLDPGEYLVCTKCGIVSGYSKRVNDPGLEVLRNNIKLEEDRKAKEQHQVSRSQEILNADFEYWTKTYLQDFGKSSEKNLELLRKFSVFTVASVNDAARRAIQESEDR